MLTDEQMFGMYRVTPFETVRVMLGLGGDGIKTVMNDLRERGVLAGYNAIRLADVQEHHRSTFIRAASKAMKIRARQSALANTDEAWRYLYARVGTYRKNAERRGLAFDLSADDIAGIYTRSNGYCEVTRIAFSLDRYGSRRAPFSPSLDRIDSARGYTKDNVRVVCQLVNLAMNVWGDRVIHELARKLMDNQRPPD